MFCQGNAIISCAFAQNNNLKQSDIHSYDKIIHNYKNNYVQNENIFNGEIKFKLKGEKGSPIKTVVDESSNSENSFGAMLNEEKWLGTLKFDTDPATYPKKSKTEEDIFPVKLIQHEKKISNCIESDLDKSAINDTTEEEKITLDLLFIEDNFLSKHNIEIEPEKLFGKKAFLSIINSSLEKENNHNFFGVNIGCLPYRIVMTNKYLYKLQGLSALSIGDSLLEGKLRYHKEIDRLKL